jgi:hypothetical protein
MDGLAPWDEASYFDTPQTTIVNIATASSSQLVGADPNRVSLIVSVSTAGGQQAILPGKAPTGSTAGIQVSNTFPFMITFRDYGPLVQQAWFGFNQNPTPINFVVVTQALLKWPAGMPPPDAAGWARLANAVMGAAERRGPRATFPFTPRPLEG